VRAFDCSLQIRRRRVLHFAGTSHGRNSACPDDEQLTDPNLPTGLSHVLTLLNFDDESFLYNLHSYASFRRRSDARHVSGFPRHVRQVPSIGGHLLQIPVHQHEAIIYTPRVFRTSCVLQSASDSGRDIRTIGVCNIATSGSHRPTTSSHMYMNASTRGLK
jgi:hypothetical protein